MDPRLVRKKMLLVMPSRMAAEIISGVIQSEAAWEVVGWTKSVSESVASARELKADGARRMDALLDRTLSWPCGQR